MLPDHRQPRQGVIHKRGLYSRFWVGVAIVLSIVVAVVGYPAFSRSSGFPASLAWTAAAVAGVWLTYLIRAWAFSSTRDETGSRNP